VCRRGRTPGPAPDGLAICKTLIYTCRVGLHWEDEDAAYISSRSTRYPGAVDIDPAWTQEVREDDRLVVLKPYPNSRIGATGLIGHSPSAGRVLVVIAYQDLDGDWHGLNAWPASGRDLATYLDGDADGEKA
jgi:hypothetical protein